VSVADPSVTALYRNRKNVERVKGIDRCRRLVSGKA
jgi:hypothetical protein